MSSVMLFLYFILSLCLCNASYHAQYRVPQISTERWESYVFHSQEYIIQNIPVKWEDAEIICRGHHNGSLAILDTAEKAEFLAEVLAETQLEVDSVWVGARRQSSEDSAGYMWFGDVPLRRTAADVFPSDSYILSGTVYKHYPSWLNRTHVPVPDEGADCVALDRVNHDLPVFLDLPCVLERPFACVRENHHQLPVTEMRVVRCKAGLYHVFNGRLNWDQAAAHCVMNKMTLANIASMKCLKKLGMTMLKTRPSIETAWIGARGSMGKWTWIDNGLSIFVPSPLLDTEPANWPPLRDPKSLKRSGCLQLDRHSSHPPVFLEGRCERKMQFICYEYTSSAGASVRRTSLAPPNDDNYYYVLVKQPMIWQHAYENCEKMNGSLAMVDTNEILIQLLLLMGENKEQPIDHVWISGRLNKTRDAATDSVTYFWYNPTNGKRVPDKRNADTSGATFIPPWLDEEFTSELECLNLDRQDHLSSLVYGLPCDNLQPSICMIERSRYYSAVENPKVPETPERSEVRTQQTIVPPASATAPAAAPEMVKQEPQPAAVEAVAPSDVAQDLASEQVNSQ